MAPATRMYFWLTVLPVKPKMENHLCTVRIFVAVSTSRLKMGLICTTSHLGVLYKLVLICATVSDSRTDNLHFFETNCFVDLDPGQLWACCTGRGRGSAARGASLVSRLLL
jgi:hypothetical protein